MKRKQPKAVLQIATLAVAVGLAWFERRRPIPAPSPPRHGIAEPRVSDEIPPELAETEAGRGRRARHPGQIPLAGWKDVLSRVWCRMGTDNLTLIAAGVAFFEMLAIFPALAAFVSTFALVADPGGVRQTAVELSAFMPPEAAKLLIDALSSLVAHATSQLSLGLIFSVLVALWSARAGLAALITGLNIAYEEQEKRGFVEQQIVALLLTLGALLLGAVVIVALGVIPIVLAFMPPSSAEAMLVGLARWPVLAVLSMGGVAVLYRYAPSRRQAKWQWISWGSILATLLWLLASGAFSFYVTRFGSYDAMYGSLGAVAVLLLWLWLSALIILIGATFDAEAEHQTLCDTTTGAPKPLGRRGAHMADTVGAAAGKGGGRT